MGIVTERSCLRGTVEVVLSSICRLVSGNSPPLATLGCLHLYFLVGFWPAKPPVRWPVTFSFLRDHK
jgi:hypothetical protein